MKLACLEQELCFSIFWPDVGEVCKTGLHQTLVICRMFYCSSIYYFANSCSQHQQMDTSENEYSESPVGRKKTFWSF